MLFWDLKLCNILRPLRIRNNLGQFYESSFGCMPMDYFQGNNPNNKLRLNNHITTPINLSIQRWPVQADVFRMVPYSAGYRTTVRSCFRSPYFPFALESFDITTFSFCVKLLHLACTQCQNYI